MTNLLLGVGPGADAPAAPIDYVARWGAVARWSMDEASGNRADSIGSNTLVDVNTVQTATAKLGTNAALFTPADYDNFTLADNATVSGADVDIWFSVWFYVLSLGSYRGLIGKGANPDMEYLLLLQSDNRLGWFVSGDGAAQTSVEEAGTTITANAWHYAVCGHDSVANEIFLRVDHGTKRTAAHTTGVFNGTSPLLVGTNPGDVNNQHWDGRLDEIALGKSPPLGLSALADEISSRQYASGAGLAYPW